MTSNGLLTTLASPSGPSTRTRWQLTPEAFDALLSRLAADGGQVVDRENAGREYVALRRTLLSFFTWRGSAHPAEQADETLDRVARRLAEGETVDQIHRYVYGVARRVFLESAKRRVREVELLAGWQASHPPSGPRVAEERVVYLDPCLRCLPGETRTLLAAYYEGQGEWHLESRKALARQLGITYGALKVRVHRARTQLKKCLRKKNVGRK